MLKIDKKNLVLNDGRYAVSPVEPDLFDEESDVESEATLFEGIIIAVGAYARSGLHGNFCVGQSVYFERSAFTHVIDVEGSIVVLISHSDIVLVPGYAIGTPRMFADGSHEAEVARRQEESVSFP